MSKKEENMKKKVKDACAYARRLKCGWSEQRDLNPHGCPAYKSFLSSHVNIWVLGL